VKPVLRFLISRIFLINLGAAILLGFGILWGTYYSLKAYTNHNEALSVPDLRGMAVAKAREALNKRSLEMVVNDSAYVPNKSPMTVIEQMPQASDKVKVNRKIYLKVSAPNPPEIEVPDLLDVSYRQARKILKTKGFQIGNLQYVPGMAKNTVVRLKNADTTVKAGNKLDQGSTIDLVLEQGRTAAKTQLPSLTGLSQSEASFYLKGKGLNFGSKIYDSTVVDTPSAIIYKQRPLYEPNKKIAKGEIIDVWLTSKKAYHDSTQTDSTAAAIPADTTGLNR
jgi:beta-lactam-binding protein with PASTA domain